MDLVTLIAACALSIEPKLMHALIWEQSGGEPWSFSLPRESEPRVYSTLHDAVREARATRPDGGRIRMGLTGLSSDPRSATAVMFAPCRNISLAARQITQFAERCKTTSPVQADPVSCGIAAYRGSWERPDTKFADAVRATVEKGNAPNFDMPKDAISIPLTSGRKLRLALRASDPLRPQSPPMVVSAAGRVHCFLQNQRRRMVYPRM